jgi:hypothetical protein
VEIEENQTRPALGEHRRYAGWLRRSVDVYVAVTLEYLPEQQQVRFLVVDGEDWKALQILFY